MVEEARPQIRRRRLRVRPPVKRTHALLGAAVIGAALAILTLIWLVRAWRGSDAIGAVMVAAVAALVLSFIWYVPKLQLSSVREHLGPDFPKVENDLRGTWAQIIGGLVLLSSLGFTWFQTNDARMNTQRSIEITEQGQINDRFTQAIGQLGDSSLELRLGGIYSLEQVAIDDPESHHWPVMQVLSAFVRAHAPLPAPDAMVASPAASPLPSSGAPPSADVQAILTVLSHRDPRWDQGVLDLSRTDLRNADLSGAKLDNADLGGTWLKNTDISGAALQNANLTGALLEDAKLNDANLAQAQLVGAQLQDSNLSDADLTGALLTGAQLNEAILQGANLTGADLTAAMLDEAFLDDAILSQAFLIGSSLAGARLTGADLHDAFGLTQQQIDAAIVDETTILPPGLHPPSTPTANDT